MLFTFATLPAERSGQDSHMLDDLIRRVATGDQEALASLYHNTRNAVYGFALSILKNVDNAEDVTQDTYVNIYHGAGSYRSQGKPMAWVLTITRNLANSRLRELNRTAPLEDAPAVQLAHNPMLDQEDRLTLEALLSHLDNQERQIITLHALTGWKHREISHLLELPLPTVLSKYHRAMKKLQKLWKEAE